MKKTLLPLILSGMLLSCDNTQYATQDEIIEQQDTVLTRTYAAKVGDTVTIKIISNPTTGYDWISDLDSNSNNLKLVGESFESTAPSDTPVMGAPSIKTLKYVMLQKGEHKASITYYRAWEEKTPKNKVKEFIFHVK
jgi:predicted secreted protein